MSGFFVCWTASILEIRRSQRGKNRNLCPLFHVCGPMVGNAYRACLDCLGGSLLRVYVLCVWIQCFLVWIGGTLFFLD